MEHLYTAAHYGSMAIEAWKSNPIMGTFIVLVIIGGLFGGQKRQYVEYYDHD